MLLRSSPSPHTPPSLITDTLAFKNNSLETRKTEVIVMMDKKIQAYGCTTKVECWPAELRPRRGWTFGLVWSGKTVWQFVWLCLAMTMSSCPLYSRLHTGWTAWPACWSPPPPRRGTSGGPSYPHSPMACRGEGHVQALSVGLRASQGWLLHTPVNINDTVY